MTQRSRKSKRGAHLDPSSRVPWWQYLAIPLVPAGLVVAGALSAMERGFYDSFATAVAATALFWVVYLALLLVGAWLWDRYGGL